MRKKSLSVLIMLMAMCIFFAIVSCDNSNDDKTNSDLESGDIQIPPSGDNTDKDGEEGDGQNHEHTHSFDTTWTKDATYHWLASTCEHDRIILLNAKTPEIPSKSGVFGGFFYFVLLTRY